MEGTIGEIRMFAGNFNPKNWSYCNGAIINIASNTALFSILGTVYGGNGTTTFALPNLQGSVAIGVGTGQGLSQRVLGQTGGTNAVPLTLNEMPAHTHPIQSSLTLKVNTAAATQAVATAGATVGKSAITGKTFNAYGPAAPSISLNTATVGAGNLTLVNAPVGNNTPHENRQPFLAMSYIICMYGIFPARG